MIVMHPARIAMLYLLAVRHHVIICYDLDDGAITVSSKGKIITFPPRCHFDVIKEYITQFH
jgi:hypothetical protein